MPRIPIWKTAPFLRLLLPLITGIILQWYVQFAISFIFLLIICFATAFVLIQLLPVETRFGIRSFQGILLQFIIVCFAMLLVWEKDIRNQHDWYGHYCNDSSRIIITI